MNLSQITSLADYLDLEGNGKAERALGELEKIQTDFDYDVNLQQVYAYWAGISKLVTKSCFGVVDVNEFYYGVLKNSGIIDFCPKTRMDEMVIKKLNGITIEKYVVGLKQLDTCDNVTVDIQIKFSFNTNSMIDELNYRLLLEIESTGDIVAKDVKTNHKWKCPIRGGFFKELEEVDNMLSLINKIIPYSYDYYLKRIPPLIFDDTEYEENDEDY